MVWIAAVAEPAPGSVMAIAPQAGGPSPLKADRKRFFCSGVPAFETAEPPRAPEGMRR